jgi:hypothetical protein
MLMAGAGPAAAAYAKACGSYYKNWTTVDREFPSGDALTGVIADVRVRTQRPCTSGGGDQPFVLVTLQRSGTGFLDDLVQIGYAKCNVPGGCNNIPNDGQHHFVYTRADNMGGLMWLFDTFYHAPEVGHEYRFRITTGVSGGDNIWTYCIRDKAEEPDYTCRNGGSQNAAGDIVHERSWNSGRFAWYGAETTNAGTQMGVANNEADLNMRWMQYRRTGTWYVAEPTTCVKATQVSYPSWYQCSTVSTVDVDGDGVVNDKETLQVWTTDH